MPISRREIQRMFLRDAERAKQQKAKSLEAIKTAPERKSRLLEFLAPSLSPVLPGGAATGAALSIAVSPEPEKALQTQLSAAQTGLNLAAGGGLGGNIGEFLKSPKQLAKLAPVLESAGVPEKVLKPLKTFAAEQKKKDVITEKRTFENKKVKAERAFKAEESEKERQFKLTENKKVRAEKAVQKATKDAIRKFERKVDNGEIDNTEENFRNFTQDRVQAVVFQKFPEFDTQKQTVGSWNPFTGFKKEIEKKVRTGRFIKAGTQRFNSVAEARAANLPKGTIVIINGQEVEID